ncbi:LuxR C-terminal-related transcriptional regulator [Kutzneria sp. CA-103260]|uniref:LuxR C-terminal-related transcriptional regulator n=1 Tax=Kutzneria sp. CA-103260 TaxID=2802641 RepID=UPI001BA51E55|nr:LuxR C-terminal-related transcriptional regulator [Kutzneria sp. CA-103260]QUQ66209.1 HTH-type transcriptional regulator MalT [Kutzneria sp. CA-103260]
MCAETAAAYAVTPGGDPLMSAKLRVAEIRSRVVLRPRLLDRLQEATRGPLTLIGAPAGSGKTVLASSWLSAGRAPGRVTWLSLDAGDDQPGIFWTYALEGLTRSGVRLDGVDPPARADAVDRSLLTRLAAGLSEQAEPSVLVLDNVEVLGRGQVIADIDFLIRHASPQLRVVTISRTDPALPLHRYRLAGWLTEIRAGELAFTVDEARMLLAEHGARVAADTVELLAHRTEGWAAGLRLAALSLQDQDLRTAAEIARRFGGGRQDVAEYFLAEVLDHQPAGIREFLLRTSVVDRLPPQLADELSGRTDSARLLRDMVRANAFVLPTDEGGFRYHRLYRELLRTQLGSRPTEEIARLHRTAARWLAADGQIGPAAAQAAAAGEWTRAATLVVENLSVGGVLTGADEQLADVFADMPENVQGPHATVVLAALALADGDHERCARQLALARRAVDNARPPASRALRLAITALDAAGAGPDEAVAAAARFDEVAAEPGQPPPPDLLAVVGASSGAARLLVGGPDEAEDTLMAAARSADAAGLGRLRAKILGQLALLNAIRGRLRRAGKFAFAATRVADRCGQSGEDRPAAIDTALAWIHLDQYDLPAARRHTRTRADQDDPVTAAALSVLRDRLLRKRTDADAEAKWPPWLAAAGQDAEAGGVLAAQVESLLRKAARDLDHGRGDLTRQALSHALRLAAPESLRRPILDAPSRLRRFLLQDRELLERHRWLGGTLAVVPTMRPSGESRPAALVEPLTDREHEVLRNMAALLSTEEIARAMFVSVNTVKTHIRGILRKLSVNRRNDAIRRARELGLLAMAADESSPTEGEASH